MKVFKNRRQYLEIASKKFLSNYTPIRFVGLENYLDTNFTYIINKAELIVLSKSEQRRRSLMFLVLLALFHFFEFNSTIPYFYLQNICLFSAILVLKICPEKFKYSISRQRYLIVRRILKKFCIIKTYLIFFRLSKLS